MGLGSTKDKMSGVVKETAGGITGDEDLRREGQAQQARTELHQKASSMTDHASNALHKTANRVSDATHRRT